MTLLSTLTGKISLSTPCTCFTGIPPKQFKILLNAKKCSFCLLSWSSLFPRGAQEAKSIINTFLNRRHRRNASLKAHLSLMHFERAIHSWRNRGVCHRENSKTKQVTLRTSISGPALLMSEVPPLRDRQQVSNQHKYLIALTEQAANYVKGKKLNHRGNREKTTQEVIYLRNMIIFTSVLLFNVLGWNIIMANSSCFMKQ